MCGILCEICYGHSSEIVKDSQVLRRINQRGPDFSHKQNFDVNVNSCTKIYFYGSVLWMQGNNITPQPIENQNGILLFNGDIFDKTWSSELSDTQIIMNKLSENNDDDSTNREDHLINVFRSLIGPFSLIYYDKGSRSVFFARDRLGRSTLLLYKDDKQRILLSNVLGRDYENCLEVPAENIFSYNIEKKSVYQYSWSGMLRADILTVDEWCTTQKYIQNKPDDEFSFKFDTIDDLTDNDDIINLIESTAKEESDKLTFMTKLLDDTRIKDVVLKVTKLLEESVFMRVKRQPQKCKICINNSYSECKHSPVGILFSGGLDCTILALLVDRYLPKTQSIELINVAFSKNDTDTFNVPDRLTGKQSYEELLKLCPKREWDFKEVNVRRDELVEHQKSSIADLVYPRKTILDESLGSALWFAARGIACDNTISSSRVLLLGSGADELFGGYSRHRNAYKRFGWSGLAKELMLDWKRISVRNLSRDNRVICDHGRQPRMPYLDEQFSSYVLHLKPWFKCFPSELLGPGVGDKLLLRLVALNLGLSDVVLFPKRALQFGSRIANKKEKGSDTSKSFEKVVLPNVQKV